MTVNLMGIDINYIVEGEGADVVLLHGWGSSTDAYRGVINALKHKCRLFALDFPGCGKTPAMSSPWTLGDYCNLVLEFIKSLNLNNPIMIGHSHGGRVILKMAGSGMVSPSKIVLIDSAGLIPKKSLRQKARAKSFKAIKTVLTLPGIKNHSEPLLQKAREYYGSADYNAAPEVLRKTLVSLVNTDLTDILPNIKASTLLIWGDNDTATPLSDGEKIKSLIKDSGICVLKGTGHFSFVEKPFEAHAILNSFLP
ncbi:MAG: alpha/beta hydrolase [Clostridia bacterium]|nr:alpha/beta hydrolase [Clostridia bacterium]